MGWVILLTRKIYFAGMTAGSSGYYWLKDCRRPEKL